MNLVPSHPAPFDGIKQIARLNLGVLDAVYDDSVRSSDDVVVHFLADPVVASGGVDVHARLKPIAQQNGTAGGRHGDDDVGTAGRTLRRSRLGQTSIPSFSDISSQNFAAAAGGMRS